MTGRKQNMNSYCASKGFLRSCCADRLTSLPNELLGRILSLLPTKDVAATQVLCKRMRPSLSWITSVDLVYSPASLCAKCPIQDERFPLFKSFVIYVLHKLHHSQQSLTGFRLRLGGDKNIPFLTLEHHCNNACFPDVEPARLHAWISYPLAHCGLRELDLSLLVRNPNDSKLPPSLFACQSLEVLKLDFNLEIDDCAHIPRICLPNLKLLCLHSFVFNEDDFVNRLVSSCPALEDLSITYCSWKKSDHLTISSHSLQRLVLNNFKCDEEKNSELVVIDTPNLQYFDYFDNLSFRYSVNVKALVEACIYIRHLLQLGTFETAFLCQLDLLRSLSDVQHLSLFGMSAEIMAFVGELKYQLPIFHNLRTLELGPWGFFDSRWDSVLLLILHRSPLLEALVFPEGLFDRIHVRPSSIEVETAALEAECWRSAATIPSCCLTHLKRIEFGRCFGTDRELNVIKFLLRAVSVLKDLVISLTCMSKDLTEDQSSAPNLEQFELTLKELPRASNSCFITVQRHI
ncbi:F-box/LRR-repeat protein At4g14103-like [Silene latifolia]|uniref:F-box/LRR-repeat protein At4g14103-like n=1 Tax=Silene latifolia TaxID=37657 RepID=UPI003D78874A